MAELKDNIWVRRLVKPYMDGKARNAYAHYLRSPDHYYMKTLKGIHSGERCFIIGNGPSLRGEDLDRLCNEYTFAANRIFNIFPQTSWRPSYYMNMDPLIIKETQDQLGDYELGHMFIRWGYCKIRGTTNKLTRVFAEPLEFDVYRNRYKDTSAYFSEDVSERFCGGWTVTFVAMQLAAYMGFKEMYLLGVDHNYSHTVDASGNIQVDQSVKDYFESKRSKNNVLPTNILSSEYNYIIAKEYCDNHGIKICNATRGGKLEIFERVDFDKLMGKKENAE